MNAVKDKTFLISIGSAIGVCFFLVGLTYNVTNWKRDIEEAHRIIENKQIALEEKCEEDNNATLAKIQKVEDMLTFLFSELDIDYQKKT